MRRLNLLNGGMRRQLGWLRNYRVLLLLFMRTEQEEEEEEGGEQEEEGRRNLLGVDRRIALGVEEVVSLRSLSFPLSLRVDLMQTRSFSSELHLKEEQEGAPEVVEEGGIEVMGREESP